MKISIVTTSYNSVSFIKETIESVVNQQGDFEIEYILQDAESTDGTWDIIQQYVEKFKGHNRINLLAASEKDGGMYTGINKGLAKMTGDVWSYLNADDILMPDSLLSVAKYFAEMPEVDMIYGQGVYMDQHSKFFGLYPSFDISEVPLVDNCYISQPSAFLRKNVFDKLGGFNDRIKNSGDYEYWLRVQSAGLNIKFVPNVLSATRIHTGTKTNTNREKIQYEVMAITSHYNDGKVPTKWKQEFLKENSIFAHLLDFDIRLSRKFKEVFSKKFASLFTLGKGRKIKQARNKYFG